MSFLLGNHGAHMLNGNTVQTFNIAYLNMQGMKPEKLELIEKYLNGHKTTILCVAETWFKEYKKCTEHKFFIKESIKGENFKSERHSGGLMIFAHSEIHKYITVTERDTLHLTIRVEDKFITSVYFRPSMTPEQIITYMNNHITRKPNILMGDFNANFNTGELIHRQEAILEFCSPRNLTLKPYTSTDSNGEIIKRQKIKSIKIHNDQHVECNCDFVFTSIDVKHKSISYKKSKRLPIETDHGLLVMNKVEFPNKTNITAPERLPNHITYNVWKFRKDSRISAKFIQHYEQNTKKAFIELKQQYSDSTPVEQRQKIVDKISRFIEQSIHKTCKTILGRQQQRKKGHYKKSKLILMLQKSDNSSDANHLYKLYKHDNFKNTPEGDIATAAEHFETLYKITTPSSIQNTIPELPPNAGDERLNRLIINQCNDHNIYNIIKNYPNSKCAGPEKIPLIILNELKESQIFITHIVKLFEICIKWELTPTTWNSSLISTIPKNNKDKFTPQNSRGIAITAVFRRFFEKMLLRTTELDDIKDFFKLHPNQAGFTKKVNTIPNLLLLNDSMQFGRPIKVFIDLKAAYDKTDIKHILQLLVKRNVPSKLINLIKTLFTNCYSSVIFDDSVSDEFYRETGIFQGSLLAPLLFNIFIDTLAEDLQKETDEIYKNDNSNNKQSKYSNIQNVATKCKTSNCTIHKLQKANNPALSNDHFFCPSCPYAARTKGNVTAHINKNHKGNNQVTNEYQKLMPHYLFFADDIALNGRNQNEVQRLLDVVGKWCTDYGMSPGFAKCNYISDRDTNLTLLEHQLDRTDSYKYLGMPITHEGIDFPTYMDKQYTKTHTEFLNLKLNGNYFANSAHRINVLKSHVLSHLEYATQLVSLRTQAQNSNIQSQKEKITKLIKDCRKWASAPIIKDGKIDKWMTNIWDYNDLLKYRRATLHELITNLPQNNPLKILIERQNQIPAILKNTLLSLKSTQSEIYHQYKARQSETNDFTLKLSTFLNSLKFKDIQDIKGIIYTLPAKKTHKSKTDVVFSIRDPQTRRAAIRFRHRILYSKKHTIFLNDKGPTFLCNKCNQNLSNEHLTECQIIKQEAFKNPKLWIYYQMERVKLKTQHPEATNYTFLDFLLNNNHYRLFYQLYQTINANAEIIQNDSPKESLGTRGVEERRTLDVNEDGSICSLSLTNDTIVGRTPTLSPFNRYDVGFIT